MKNIFSFLFKNNNLPIVPTPTIFQHDSRDILEVGQKVECWYYHEYDGEPKCYKRPIKEKIIDKPFTPVKLGIIVGDAGIHPYWLGRDYKQRYLFVKFDEYKYPKAIPISCISDAKKMAEGLERLLAENATKIGQKVCDMGSYVSLTNQMLLAKEFIQ